MDCCRRVSVDLTSGIQNNQLEYSTLRKIMQIMVERLNLRRSGDSVEKNIGVNSRNRVK